MAYRNAEELSKIEEQLNRRQLTMELLQGIADRADVSMRTLTAANRAMQSNSDLIHDMGRLRQLIMRIEQSIKELGIREARIQREYAMRNFTFGSK